jgi:sugar phosphate isomerase/epimerase
MRIDGGDGGDAHLGYCTNVHPSATLPAVLSSLYTHVAAVKARVSPEQPMGVGLWLSHAAARALLAEGGAGTLAAALRELGLYCFTFNGFPFGAFHGQAVKAEVYRPDWRDRARLEHTNLLATLLAELLPDGVDGSVSTLPGAFARDLAGPVDEDLIAAHLLEHAAQLHALHARTGKRVALAIEPEPCCMLETTPQVVAFFERALYGRSAQARLAALCGVGVAEAAVIARRHLGVCLDACHAAVEHEQPRDVLDALERAGIPIAKLQISSGLRAPRADRQAREALARFAEPVYLHHVIARAKDGTLTRYEDLPPALAAAQASSDDPPPEWRVHFHVPLHRARFGLLESTQPFVRELLAAQRARPFTRHLEVETYTWEVLPPEERPAVLADGLADELRFCLRELGATPRVGVTA